MNVQEIQSHVTHFSEELKYRAIHEQEVTVGGKITNIVPPLDDDLSLHIVMVDDNVGVNYIFVPDAIMSRHLADFQVGKYVFIEGFVNIVTRTIKKQIKKEISIFAYSMKDITKVGDTK